MGVCSETCIPNIKISEKKISSLNNKIFFICSFTTDPFVRISFWSLVIGRFVSSTQTVGTGQTSVQRYCALPTKRKAQL